VERLHNTVRERAKVMRGLHSDKSAAVFNEGFKAYYNFVRPNQALNGKTPAQVAGVDLKLGEHRWLGLVKKAKEKRKQMTRSDRMVDAWFKHGITTVPRVQRCFLQRHSSVLF